MINFFMGSSVVLLPFLVVFSLTFYFLWKAIHRRHQAGLKSADTHFDNDNSDAKANLGSDSRSLSLVDEAGQGGGYNGHG